jgi:hypothetical protein
MGCATVITTLSTVTGIWETVALKHVTRTLYMHVGMTVMCTLGIPTVQIPKYWVIVMQPTGLCSEMVIVMTMKTGTIHWPVTGIMVTAVPIHVSQHSIIAVLMALHVKIQTKKVQQLIHRTIWNVLLTISHVWVTASAIHGHTTHMVVTGMVVIVVNSHVRMPRTLVVTGARLN